MLYTLMVTAYMLLATLFIRDFLKGIRVHKANFSHFKYGFIPRFTVRASNGRFKANKVGIFYVATH